MVTSSGEPNIFSPTRYSDPTKEIMSLSAVTARELMVPDPITLRENTSLKEAAAVFVDRRISSVPIVDGTDNPVGVLSLTDLVRYERERSSRVARAPDFYHAADLELPSGEDLQDGFQVEGEQEVMVSDIMTPMVLAVTPEVSSEVVVAEMLARRVHRLFVVDSAGTLVGVISALDILRCLE